MDLGLAGKVALVTGATSGIGLAIARRLAGEGCKVAICGRDRERLARAVGDLESVSTWIEGVVADMRVAHAVKALVDRTVAAFGALDIVVSNAGTHLPGRIDEVAPGDFADHLQTKVIGAWELARLAAPHMRRRGGGRFIVIIGQAGKVPQANAIASAVTNAAQHAFVKSLSDELGRSNILVNAVCPSRIATPLTDQLPLHDEVWLGRSFEQQRSRWGADVPLGRRGEPEDVADAVAFLASERAGFICGANIDVDGGHQRSIM
jgi:3-oxoacyl-[acyl-carrier protein] reductase/bacilysin biosynthesis oxidoreductase BacG